MNNQELLPIVSVCSTTFNNAPYTRQCLDGILMQITSFPFEVIINDDCSTDGTTEILREYEKKFPGVVKPIYHEENLYSKGIRGLYRNFCFPKAKGKYIACCDGDDYWTDPLKLQKQYDIMEANPQFVLCHHNYRVLNNETGIIVDNKTKVPSVMDLAKAASHGYIHNSSMFFRNLDIELIPSEIKFPYTPYQYFWALRLAEFGDIYYIDEAMEVYRVHSGGTFNGSSQRKKIDMSLGNLTNMVLWYEYRKKPQVVRNLKKRARTQIYYYMLSSLKHLNLNVFLYLMNWYKNFI